MPSNNIFNLGFWEKLPKPFFALAPMADVTDLAFRQMFVRYGKPDVMFTEFVSTDGLCSAGRDNLLKDLRYFENERPIVAQIWGTKPENFTRAVKILKKLKFDGVDINMGCPKPKEIKNGACAALIRNPKLALKIIAETKRAAGTMPVSIKTRIGFKEIQTESWIGKLLKTQPAAITIHCRTAAEMSKVPARWEEIARAVKIRNKLNSRTLIVGNGDVATLEEGKKRAAETGADGVMVGRGAFGNPWFFDRNASLGEIGMSEKLNAMLEHAHLFEKLFKGKKNFAVMKKHFKAYAAGFPGARELRVKLMATENVENVERAVNNFKI
ncbi:MAG: tRNA-dihydrouridine synthase [Patescibacteria group bacterium]